jgi:hypothetical protein
MDHLPQINGKEKAEARDVQQAGSKRDEPGV